MRLVCILQYASVFSAFILCCTSLVCTRTLADSSVVTDDVIIGQGVGAFYTVEVRFADPVHVEWSANQTIQYELSYQTEILENGFSYFGPVDAGHDMEGNITFSSAINGTYTLELLNDADGPVHIHVAITVTFTESRIDLGWAPFGAALAVAAVVLLALILRKKTQRGKK